MSQARALAALLLLGAGLAPVGASPQIDFPTDNTALLAGNGPEFYQYVERDFRGEKTRPWQGGQYGFVRGPLEWGSSFVLTRFHEGIDIRPVRRGPDGAPLDEVRAIADGRVVHVAENPAQSNYGRFVVVEHRWDGSPYYSLYAHLRTAEVRPGQSVPRGTRLGIMGWTGDGLDITRAHLHLELGLRLSERFEEWHATAFAGQANHHGTWNGLNLVGIDIAGFYRARAKDPSLSIPAFLATQPVAFRAAVPATPNLSLLERYPWLVARRPSAGSPPAWEISFTAGGVPVSAAPWPDRADLPKATWAAPPRTTLLHATRGLVTGTPDAPRLSATGTRNLRLLTWPD